MPKMAPPGSCRYSIQTDKRGKISEIIRDYQNAVVLKRNMDDTEYQEDLDPEYGELCFD